MEDRGGRCEANSGGRGGLLCLSAYLLSHFLDQLEVEGTFLSKHLVCRIEKAELLFCSQLQRHLAENLKLQVALARGS
jgi:hypothetical protein